MGNQSKLPVPDPPPVSPRPLGAAATAIIGSVYAMGASDADPHALLTDLARSTTVMGKLLANLSDEYNGVGKKLAGSIALIGRVFWGLVEVSVPDSLLFYLWRNWIWIIELLAVLIIFLGFLVGVPAMWSIGLALLVAVIICYQLSHALYIYMSTGTFRWKLLKGLAFGVLAILIVIGACYVSIHDGKKIADFLEHVEHFFLWTSTRSVR